MHTVTWLNTDDQHLAQVMQYYLLRIWSRNCFVGINNCVWPRIAFLHLCIGELTVIDSVVETLVNMG